MLRRAPDSSSTSTAAAAAASAGERAPVNANGAGVGRRASLDEIRSPLPSANHARPPRPRGNGRWRYQRIYAVDRG